MSAPIPANEEARLAELHSYSILDTPPEQDYDNFTFLAAQICEVPVSLVSLVDRDRQWFKSSIGMDVRETPRDIAFCSHAVWDPSQLLIVNDAAKDKRFAGNPLVSQDPNIRFYAGAPLLTSTGNALGTLCVIDYVPRELTQDQQASLDALARMVMAQLELRRVAHQIHAEKERAEEGSRAKTIFLANMSHEIRTPLNAILGLSELMVRQAHGSLGSELYREYAGDIHTAGDHLLSLINDILDLSRIEAGKLTLSESQLDVEATVAGALRLLGNRADDKGIELATRVPSGFPWLWADERRVRQMLVNLVANAIKFTPAGGRVAVSTAIGATGEVAISVKDTGRGMSPAQIETALTVFGQAASEVSSEGGGSGLGLPITERLIVAHGGRLELTSEPGRGTEAVLIFPANRSPGARELAASA